MAKKVRFPLVMEDDTEVRSLKELKDNFSLARVLGYVSDGRLVTWLENCYANDLARQVEALDKGDEQLAEKICRIFAVPYDASSLDEVEKAEERKRKRVLLQRFPTAQDYADRIDFIAFQQDDLYELLDEGAEEIYLCGEEFSIPPSIERVKFIGIIEGVVVCIEAQEPVDFGAKGIEFVNCTFDPEYQKIVSGATKGKWRVEEAEIADVVRDLTEAINEFSDAEFDNTGARLYRWPNDESEFYFAQEAGEESFDSKVAAKVAYKEALEKIINDAIERYDKERQKIFNATAKYYAPMVEEIVEFLASEFNRSYEGIVDVYCSESTKEYMLSRWNKFKNQEGAAAWQHWEQIIKTECEACFTAVIKEMFDPKQLWDATESRERIDGAINNAIGLNTVETKEADGTYTTVNVYKALTYFCDLPMNPDKRLLDTRSMFYRWKLFDNSKVFYATDERYHYDTFSARNKITLILNYNVKIIAERFPEEVHKCYDEIRTAYATKLLKWLDELTKGLSMS